MTHDPYAWARDAIKEHRWRHRCMLYRFEDGPLIADIAAVTRPRRVLELGTLVGHTGCCWAAAGAQVVTVEPEAQHVALARTTITQAGLSSRAQVIHGHPDDVLQGIDGSFDVVFVHADLDSAPLRLALATRLAVGGALLVTESRPGGCVAVVELDEGARAGQAMSPALATRALGHRPAAAPGGRRP